METNDRRIKSREAVIRRQKDEIATLRGLVKVSQAYIACLIDTERGGHVEVDKASLVKYIDRPELVKTRISGDKYIIDVARPE